MEETAKRETPTVIILQRIVPALIIGIVTGIFSAYVALNVMGTRLTQLEAAVLYHHQVQEPAQQGQITSDHDAILLMQGDIKAMKTTLEDIKEMLKKSR